MRVGSDMRVYMCFVPIPLQNVIEGEHADVSSTSKNLFSSDYNMGISMLLTGWPKAFS